MTTHQKNPIVKRRKTRVNAKRGTFLRKGNASNSAVGRTESTEEPRLFVVSVEAQKIVKLMKKRKTLNSHAPPIEFSFYPEYCALDIDPNQIRLLMQASEKVAPE